MTARVLQGDCRVLMAGMPEASVDSIVTDPPYELTSIVKRFGAANAAPCRPGTDGAFGRVARGFMGQVWDGSGVAFDPAMWASALRVLKPGGHLLAFGGARTYHRMACAIEDAGFELRDQIMWIYGSGFPKSHNCSGEHEGWGTAIKPAHEPIAVARKPLIGTVAANMAAHGVGALNIDGCRIGYNMTDTNPATNPLHRKLAGYANGAAADTSSTSYRLKDGSGERNPNGLGRWPANVIHDGSEEVVARFPDTPGQQGYVGPENGAKTSRGIYGNLGPMSPHHPRGDVGTAARFFYAAKASKADREEGCDTLPLQQAGQVSETSGQHITRRDEGYELPKRRNAHPTVKPESLMRYLVRLVTPIGGTVLDPFTGSGSTGKAAVLEGMSFIGCELTPEYVPVAEARIAAAVTRIEAEQVASLGAHPDLFGAAA